MSSPLPAPIPAEFILAQYGLSYPLPTLSSPPSNVPVALTGTCAGHSGASGALSLSIPLSGACAGTSAAYGTIIVGSVISLTGYASGTSGLLGTLGFSVPVPLSGFVSATGVISATLTDVSQHELIEVSQVLVTSLQYTVTTTADSILDELEA